MSVGPYMFFQKKTVRMLGCHCMPHMTVKKQVIDLVRRRPDRGPSPRRRQCHRRLPGRGWSGSASSSGSRRPLASPPPALAAPTSKLPPAIAAPMSQPLPSIAAPTSQPPPAIAAPDTPPFFPTSTSTRSERYVFYRNHLSPTEFVD